ncbi:MAG: lipopolysaccharide heptosyltransferase II [candidate division Zixibacteria bacterium RBG_16_43_9]|nr:MAG: lipopolysaccharide heptosyltransferase II [candidate division Zixibacteria bacterium RBG_16_43_9]
MNPQKILIIQTAFLGDVVLTTPLIKAVKKEYPRSKVFFLLIPQTKELLQNNPHLDGVIVYDKKNKEKGVSSFLALAGKIRASGFDLALIPHRSFRSALLAYLARIPQRIGFDKSSGAFLLTKKIKYIQSQSEAKRNLSLLEKDIPPENDCLPGLFPSEDDFKYIEELFRSWDVKREDKIVGVAPGSVWNTKRWLPERFGEVAESLIEKLGAKVIFIGGKEDEKLCLEIASNMKSKPLIAAGKTSPLQSAALISRCQVILSNDTAPMHIAVAMRVPVVAIFGSTIPEFGFEPTGKDDLIIQKEIYCRPCGIHGKRKCPEKHFRCIKEIQTEEVFETVTRKLI